MHGPMLELEDPTPYARGRLTSYFVLLDGYGGFTLGAEVRAKTPRAAAEAIIDDRARSSADYPALKHELRTGDIVYVVDRRHVTSFIAHAERPTLKEAD